MRDVKNREHNEPKIILQNEDNGMIGHIHDKAMAHFENAKGSHAWDHTLRVVSLCRKIGMAENADMEILIIAAYLHDIGRKAEDDSKGAVCHAVHGSLLARPIVASLPISIGRKENILHAIRTHRYRGNDIPETREARILFDSDKIDAIGAIGVARAYLFAGEVGARLHNSIADVENTKAYSEEDTGYREYMVKLRNIKDRILTGEGRKIAEERHRFMEAFFNRFLEEYEGKR